MIHYKIIPDSRIINDKVEQFVQSLYMYDAPIERYHDWKLEKQNYFSFETVISTDKTSFYITIPSKMKIVTKKAIETTWSKAVIEESDEPFQDTPNLTTTLELKNHYVFAIKVDRRENTYLQSLLETLNFLEVDEKVYIQTLAISANPHWHQSAAEAYQRFQKGEMPQKVSLNKKTIGRSMMKAVAYTVLGATNVVSELITGSEGEKINLDEAERAMILRDGKLRTETIQKTRGDAFDMNIRIGVVCQNDIRARDIMRMVTTSFRSLDGDNQLIENKSCNWKRVMERKAIIRPQRDYMSVSEVSRFVTLPNRPLQEQYGLESIKILDTNVHQNILLEGMLFATQESRGTTRKLYQPTKNYEELCLPRVVIAGMGQGKTKGYGANIAVQAVKNGFSAIVIDPAKGEMGDEIEKGLPPDKIIRINIAKQKISLDWCESKYAPFAKDMLVDTLQSFFDTNMDETGGQTARYITGFVMAMRTNRLSEILKLMEDEKYLEASIKKMPDSFNKTTLLTFQKESDGKKRQLLAPIYNRLGVIMSSTFLMSCFESVNSIDMVQLMSQKKAIVFDVLKKDGLSAAQIDIIVNLLTTKISLAMQLRKEENQHPCFVIYDEPAQFLKSAKYWEFLATESRKWRVGFVWLFHDWLQLPLKLREIIKSALPHYHFYPSKKGLYSEFAEEIAPFTVEDGMKLPQFHAINIIRTDGDTTPFIAKMLPPPSKQKALLK